MAPKQVSNPKEDPPSAFSSEEEEIGSESEEEEIGSESEEEEEEHKVEKKTKIQSSSSDEDSDLPPPIGSSSFVSPTKKTKMKTQSSSSDDVDDDDDDDDSDLPPAIAIVKKHKSAAQVEASVDNIGASAAHVKESKKRQTDVEGESNLAKKKQKGNAQVNGEAVGVDVSSSKKPLFERKFFPKDEIALLNAMHHYSTQNHGADPMTDVDAFFKVIKKILVHIDFTKPQVLDKMKRLKQKYENNARRGKNGNDRTFSNADEKESYYVSKKLWGQQGIHTGEGVKLIHEELVKQDLGLSASIFNNYKIDASCLNETFMKEGLALIDEGTKMKLEKEWKKLQLLEIEIFMKRIALFRDLAEIGLDAIKKQ